MNLVKKLVGLVLGERPARYAGNLVVPGAAREIVIRRDQYAVPYISAHTENDAWYGLGFCHGQDRAGQLEVVVRAVRGTLAEAIGKDGIAIDRLSRRIGFRPAAEAQLAASDAVTQAQLAAYARGVNAGTRRGGDRLAHEFALLRREPTPWEAADVQGYFALLCFCLASNWDMELVRLRILQQDGPEALAALDPGYPDWIDSTTLPGPVGGAPAAEVLDRLSADLDAFHAVVAIGGASNAWAVSGERTRSGRPICANDPHLAPTFPNTWYLAHLRTPAWTTAGATFVGIPAIGAGHNGHGAWGLTAAHADNTDLFLEEIGPDGRSVRAGDRFVPAPVRREEIRVRGGKTIVEEVVVTPRGPIVGPALAGESAALSLSATWLKPRPYQGFFGVHRTRSFDEFRECYRAGSTSSAAVVYADQTGTIGWSLVAELPERRKGAGSLPLPGWDPEVGWGPEPTSFDELPHVVDPARGFVCTANNRPAPDGHGPFLGNDFLDGYRHANITAALGSRTDWDLDLTEALQRDVRSLPWRELREHFVALAPDDADTRAALAILGDWDGEVSGDSAAATIFHLTVVHLIQRLVKRHAPRAAEWALGRGFTGLFPHNLMPTRRISHLVDLVRNRPGVIGEPWSQAIERAVGDAYRELRRRFGDRPTRWAWGRVRPLRMVHPFGEKAPLDRVFNLRPLPISGDATTVAQFGVDLRDPLGNSVSVPSMRMAIDVGNWEAARFQLLGGQSGNPLSPHYDDLVRSWQNGRGITIAWSTETILRRTRHTLRLLPERAS